MNTLEQRSAQTEVMDDLNSSGEVLNQALRELETINALLGGNAVTFSALRALLRDYPAGTVLHIADLGCGGGDMVKRIYKWGKKRRFEISVSGIDANPNVVEFASRHVSLPGVNFEVLNIFDPEFRRRKYDVVTGTLFYHHFTHEELVSFFSHLKDQVRIGFIINDIHRHPFALHSIRILTRLFSKSSMVKNDAPLSVRRAFKRSELVSILQAAGIQDYSIRWKWAFRWEVVIRAGGKVA